MRGLGLFLAFVGATAAEPSVDLFQEDVPPEPAEVATLIPSSLGHVPAELAARAAEVRNLPLPERMKAISDLMLDRPYVADPLGEGGGIDPDPLARYDAYDCLTFVEEVLALSLAGDPAHAASVRLALRYRGREPRYEHRQHFMELQWLPSAVADGWLRPTTAEYGPVQHYEREVTPGLWRAWGRRSLFSLTDEQLPLGTMALDWLPLDAALAAVDRIRPGSIVLAVRVDRPWVPLWITHLGFTIPAETPTFRHASRMSRSLRTRDHPLAWYLEHLGTYENWKTAGIAIFEPVEQGPRLAATSP